jgi:hypothetical protein
MGTTSSLPQEDYVGAAVVSTILADGGFEMVPEEVGQRPSRRAGASAPSSTTVSIEVDVQLRGQFEPLDGHFHWYGRIATNARLAAARRPGDTVVLTTPHGSAAGRLSDVDPWGRFRITGTGRPPF